MSKRDEYAGYERDASSFAILNTDTEAFNQYKEEREKILKLDRLAKEVQTLQQDIGDIKTLLQQLVNGKTNG